MAYRLEPKRVALQQRHIHALTSYTFIIQVPGVSTRYTNDPNEIRTSYKDSSTIPTSNTGATWHKATWHLFIGNRDEPLDPWQLWEEAEFKLANIEIITGPKGAKPFLLSYRRRGAVVPRIDKAAAKQYQEKIARTRRLLELSLPAPVQTLNIQQASTSALVRDSTVRELDKAKKAGHSRRGSLASMSPRSASGSGQSVLQ